MVAAVWAEHAGDIDGGAGGGDWDAGAVVEAVVVALLLGMRRAWTTAVAVVAKPIAERR
jgi:hypothetical protein